MEEKRLVIYEEKEIQNDFLNITTISFLVLVIVISLLYYIVG